VINRASLLVRALRNIGERLPGSAMEGRFDFDELAKDLARGIPRREALRRLGGGLVGATLASVGFQKNAWAAKPGAVRCSSANVLTCKIARGAEAVGDAVNCLVPLKIREVPEVAVKVAFCVTKAVGGYTGEALGCTGPGVAGCVLPLVRKYGDEAVRCAVEELGAELLASLHPIGLAAVTGWCVGTAIRKCADDLKTCERCDPGLFCSNNVCCAEGFVGCEGANGARDCCGTGETCCNGACCPRNLPTCCNGICVDTNLDDFNCGGCGNIDPRHICASNETCIQGGCCPPERVFLAAGHCCSPGQVYVTAFGGRCCPEESACNNRTTCCPSEQTCSGGRCVCEDGREPCDGRCCGRNAICVGSQCVCSDGREPCNGTTCCGEGEECVDGQCGATSTKVGLRATGTIDYAEQGIVHCSNPCNPTSPTCQDHPGGVGLSSPLNFFGGAVFRSGNRLSFNQSISQDGYTTTHTLTGSVSSSSVSLSINQVLTGSVAAGALADFVETRTYEVNAVVTSVAGTSIRAEGTFSGTYGYSNTTNCCTCELSPLPFGGAVVVEIYDCMPFCS
jgi:hypothetical protein